MKKSTKAVFLSAFVIPGAGHWYLAKRRQAVILMLASAGATYVLMSNAWTQANLIAQKIVSGEIQPELSDLMNALSEQTSAVGSSSLTIATFVLGAVWILGVVGAWFTGRAEPSE